MVTDAKIDELVQPIINLYNQMEAELIVAIAKRFDAYDSISGTLDWQIKKLNEMGALTNEMVSIIARYSKKSENEIRKLFNQAGYFNIDIEDLEDARQMGIIQVDPEALYTSPVIINTIKNSFKEFKNNELSLINTTALNSGRKAYINALNRAYLDVSSGTYDYTTAIQKAVRDMARDGITGATYKSGDKILHYSLEGAVRRDVLTAMHQTANKSTLDVCDALDCEYVEVSRHLGARIGSRYAKNPKWANHAGWQGKVYKIEGKTDEYPNLIEETGYGNIEGLGGVNCRHRMFPFFPGFSFLKKIDFSDQENEQRYKAEQKQRKLERDIRGLKKQYLALKEANADEERIGVLRKKLDNKYQEITIHCRANKLRRDYDRERVSEQL